ncbi:MAG: hypothetical protein K2O18_13305, partial [Oscillospiraceae bacterium]|nr:hypothetical protein [Oscillospiraceae bacterium]
MGRIYKAAESGKRIRDILSREVNSFGNPTGKQVVIRNKVSEVFLNVFNGFLVILGEFREIF